MNGTRMVFLSHMITSSLRLSLRTASRRFSTLSATADTLPSLANIPREGELLNTRRARLVYQSRKRGTLESCLLLSNYANNNLMQLDGPQLDLYEEFLAQNDWDIYYWVVGERETPPTYAYFVDSIRILAEKSKLKHMDMPEPLLVEQ